MLIMIDNTVQYGEDLDVKTAEFDYPDKEDDGDEPDDWAWTDVDRVGHNRDFPERWSLIRSHSNLRRRSWRSRARCFFDYGDQSDDL